MQALLPAGWYRGLERLLMTAAGMRQRIRHRARKANLLQREHEQRHIVDLAPRGGPVID
jgi:hypothetical protein